MPMIRLFGKRWNFASDDLVIICSLESILRLVVLFYYLLHYFIAKLPDPAPTVFSVSALSVSFICVQLCLFAICALTGVFSTRGGVLECASRNLAVTMFSVRILMSSVELAILPIAIIIGLHYTIPLVIPIGITLDLLVLSLFFFFLALTSDPSSWSPQHNRLNCINNIWKNEHCCVLIANLLASIYSCYNLVASDIIAGLMMLSAIDRVKWSRKATNTCEHDFTSDQIKNTLYFYKHSLAVYSWPMLVYLSGPAPTYENTQIVLSALTRRRGGGHRSSSTMLDLKAFKTLLPCMNCDILHLDLSNSVFRAPFSLTADHEAKKLVIVIRGTMSVIDILTDLSALSDTFEFVQTTGYCHHGILQTANTILEELQGGVLENALTKYPDYQLVICGHSLGAGTAVLLTMMLRRSSLPNAICYAFAAPKCLSKNLSDQCKSFTTSVVLADDIVSRLSVDSVHRLHERIIDALAHSKTPKYSLFMHFLSKGSVENVDWNDDHDDDRQLELNTPSSSAYSIPSSSQTHSSNQQQQQLPGTIMHLIRIPSTLPPNNPSFICCKRREAEHFDDIVVRNCMLSDHLPANLLKTLETLVQQIDQHRQQQQPEML